MRKKDHKNNSKEYKPIKKANKFLRDNFAPNPTKSFSVLGIIGTTIGTILNFFILIMVRPIAFAFSGVFYKKGEHPAWVGSALYTLFFFGILGLFSIGLSAFF